MATVAVAAVIATPALALSLDQRIVDGVSHFVECFGYLIVDEASHITYCSPNPTGPWFGTPIDHDGTGTNSYSYSSPSSDSSPSGGS
jgi:hypothetical protein